LQWGHFQPWEPLAEMGGKGRQEKGTGMWDIRAGKGSPSLKKMTGGISRRPLGVNRQRGLWGKRIWFFGEELNFNLF